VRAHLFRGPFLSVATEQDRLDAFFALAAYPRFITTGVGKRPITDWFDDSRVPNVIGYALQGDTAAHKALLAMMASFDQLGIGVPTELARYGRRVAVDGPPRPKRGRPVIYDARNMAIVIVVGWLERAGIPPTRSPDLRGEYPPSSGCSILRYALQRELALELTDDDIEAVWGKRDKRRLEDLLKDLPHLDLDIKKMVRRRLRPN
jgi:hypothetical protein